MSSIFGFLLFIGVVAFFGWSVYSLVGSLRDRKRKKDVKNSQPSDEKKDN